MLNANGVKPNALDDDNESLMAIMTTVLSVLADEVGLTCRDVCTIQTRTRNEGISFLTKTMPLLAKACDKALGTRVFELPSNFKRRWRDSEIPAFCGALFSQVFEKDGRIKNDPSVESIKKIRQIGFLFYKYVLPFSENCVQQTLQEFIDVDATIGSFTDSPVARYARSLTTAVFTDGYDPEDLNHSHGPGVTSDRFTSNQKFEAEFDTSSPVVRYFGLDRYNQPDNRADTQALARGFVRLTQSSHVASCPPASVITVPKDSRGPRIISCEPSVRMFAQQGIRKWTQDRLENHPLSSGSVNFSDQTINRDLVQNASRDRSFSTIDLAAASDRVSLACVQYLFEHAPIYLKSLLISRSSHTEIKFSSGEIKTVEMRKFAPMGSAVCFTTLAWVVYALSFSAIYLSSTLSVEEIKKSLYVYGDDVVVKTEFFGVVCDALENHGLKVNRNKSFFNSDFLESCGMDAFLGTPVTPIRARSLLTYADVHRTYEALCRAFNDYGFCSKVIKTVELANQLQKDYPSTSEVLYALVEKVTKRPLPFGIATSPFLCRISPTTEDAWLFNEARGIDVGRTGSRGLRGMFVSTTRVVADETPYGRLRRTLPVIGNECVLPNYGEYDKPRSYTIRLHPLERWYASAYVRKLRK